MDEGAAELIGTAPFAVAPVLNNGDSQLLDLWLAGRPVTTERAYRRDVADLMLHAGGDLRGLSLGQLQAFAGSIEAMAPASQARKLAALKSLLSFGHRTGYLAFDVGRPLRLPRVKNVLAERIIEEAEAQRLLQLEPNPRNHVLLRLMYGCGLRVSEVCGLCWRDLRGTKTGGQATVMGKGGKTRAVLMPPKLWRMTAALRGEAGPDDAVLQSRRGRPLDRSQADRIVKAAAKRAGLDPRVSSHWLRHAHASHSLDHGAPIHVVQGSLGHASLSTTTRYVHARPGDGSSKYLPE